MDWLRRNWPDLAIGLALVGVIAGIVATLVTGGSFFPVGPSAQPPATDPPPAAVAPATPGVDDPVGPAVDADPAAADEPSPVGAVSVLTPDGAEPAAAPAGGLAAPAATPAATPPATPPAATPAATPAAAPATPAATEPTPQPATPVAAPVAAATPSPAPAVSGALPSASADAEAPYRVSVGAFGNPDNAARLAATFREAGYPVFTGVQGDLTIVLVGPYAAERDAEQVAARIAAGGFGIDPVVYRFRPDAATPGASTPAPGAPEPAATPAATPAAAPTPTPAPAAAPAAPTSSAPIATASSGRSLQVGAFADADSARPLRERLATVGLVAFEVREDGLTKLLVGPFDAEGLAAARSRLAELGIESFPR